MQHNFANGHIRRLMIDAVFHAATPGQPLEELASAVTRQHRDQPSGSECTVREAVFSKPSLLGRK